VGVVMGSKMRWSWRALVRARASWVCFGWAWGSLALAQASVGWALAGCVETSAPRGRDSSRSDAGFADRDAGLLGALAELGPARPPGAGARAPRDAGPPASRSIESNLEDGAGRGAPAAAAGGGGAGAAANGGRAGTGAAGGAVGDAREAAQPMGAAADGGEATGAAPSEAGALVITELMVDPKALTDTEGEWFELYNPGDVPLDLAGCEIADGSAQRRSIAMHVAVQPHGFASIARSARPGFAPDAVATFSLKNGSDLLELACGGVVVDRVAYDKTSGFPVAAGIAMSLDARHLRADANDDGGAWCLAMDAYASDLGSPGRANLECARGEDAGMADDGNSFEEDASQRDP
jgi:Lamin Tail Domain